MGIFSTNDFKSKYEKLEKLGEGNFAVVNKVKHKETGEEYAVKILSVTDIEEYNHIKDEIEILKKLKSPYIVQVKEIFEKKVVKASGRRVYKVYIIMELVKGGELFNKIVKHKTFKESEARSVITTLLKALTFAKSMGIAHRDLKPENLLMENDDENDFEGVKVADWGLAKMYACTSTGRTEEAMETMCGTPGYVAPEVVGKRGYNAQCDVWSTGVILYVMLCGFLPFQASNRDRLFMKIKKGDFKFLSPYWDNVSPSAKDLVCKMLTVDPNIRVTTEQALEHPWMKAEKALIDDHLLNIDELEHFNDYIHAQKKWRSFMHAMMAINRLDHLSD